MQINGSTDYAVRILVYLGRNDRMVSSRKIAEGMNIPPKYMSAIICKLKEGGLVKSFQGSNGGYVLTEAAQQATLLDVINIMEGEILGERCSTCDPGCLLYREGPSCAIHAAYRTIQSAMRETVQNITLTSLLSYDGSAGISEGE